MLTNAFKKEVSIYLKKKYNQKNQFNQFNPAQRQAPKALPIRYLL